MPIESAISHLSLDEQIHEIQKKQGQVFFIGLNWFSALTLAKQHHCQEYAYSVNALSTRIEIDQSRGDHFFDRPTLLIIANDPPANIAFLAWKNIQEKAQSSPFPIEFSYDATLDCAQEISSQRKKPGFR
jgi:hypothetical protein